MNLLKWITVAGMLLAMLPPVGGKDLSGLVDDAWSADRNDVAGIVRYLREPIPTATNVVQVARDATLINFERQMASISTNYIPQVTLDQFPAQVKILAVRAALDSAVTASSGESKVVHLQNGLNLIAVKDITEKLGGGLADPYYKQLTRPVTNIVYQTRWQVHQGTNSFPTVQSIRETIRSLQ